MKIKESVDLGSDDRYDERAIQELACACGFSGLALYEESRRGHFRGEVVHHTGYRYPLEDGWQQGAGRLYDTIRVIQDTFPMTCKRSA